jgi:hypothetical protein
MSITLTNQLAITAGGVPQETDAASAATYMEVSWPNNLRIFFRTGNVVGGAFVPGNIGDAVVVTIDLSTGAWASTNGLTGTFGQAVLTNLLTMVKGWRNTAEQFASGNNVQVGTQVAWT